MLCMLIPLAIYLAKYGAWPRNEINRRIVYGLVTGVLLVRRAAAVSRTAVVVLAVMFLVTLIFRPWLGVLLIALGLPALVLGFAGRSQGLRHDGAVVPRRRRTRRVAADLARLPRRRPTRRPRPVAARVRRPPVLRHRASAAGSWSATRQNAYILDNQVLGTLLETGAVGVIGLAVLTARAR